MSLSKNTRMVDVLGDYCIVADNLHGSAQAVANVKYQFRRVTSMIENEEDSSSYYTGILTIRGYNSQPLPKDRTETSRYGQTRRVQIDDSKDTDRDELVSNRELYIYSSDDDSQLTFRQQL